MSPHIWKAVHPDHTGQWACSSKRLSLYYQRVYSPVGDVYYGPTPSGAYLNWSKANDLGMLRHRNNCLLSREA